MTEKEFHEKKVRPRAKKTNQTNNTTNRKII